MFADGLSTRDAAWDLVPTACQAPRDLCPSFSECFDVMLVLSKPQLAPRLLPRRELIMTTRQTGLEPTMITGNNRRTSETSACQIGATGA
jgi:hypothetical protein